MALSEWIPGAGVAAPDEDVAADAAPVVPRDLLAAASDRELVARTLRGDRDAGDLLARRHRDGAYVLALQILRNPDDARDVTQEALLSFFRHLGRFDGRRQVRPYLYAIVRNRARDLLRSRRRRRHEPLDPTGGSDFEEERRELLDPAPGPGIDAERAELQRRVLAALSELPEGQREILVLRDYQDLAYREIATVLSIPIGTVMSRLHRARRALAALLADLEAEISGDAPPEKDAP